MGKQEFDYNEKARRCGIIVPDFKLIDGKYFTTRRFDITADGERIHTATAGGLLSISLSNPVLDYVNLLALTGYLTQNYKDVNKCIVEWCSIILPKTKTIIARISAL